MLQTDDYLCTVPQLHVFIHITTRIYGRKPLYKINSSRIAA